MADYDAFGNELDPVPARTGSDPEDLKRMLYGGAPTARPGPPHPEVEDDGPRPGVAGFLLRRQTLLFGIAVSLFLHVLLLFVAGMLGYGGSGIRPDGDGRAVQLAVMSEQELVSLQGADISDEASVNVSLPDESMPADDFDAPVSDDALANLGLDITLAMDGVGASLSEGLEMSGSSGSGSASFFGVEASGSRFAWIVDVSGSMQGERIEALQRALINSINDLVEHTHFAIFLYSQDAIALTGTRWLPANRRHKYATVEQIRAIRASGGTNPLPAFQLAFAMKPKPDAVYFMTDGQFSEDVAEQIAATVGGLNRSEGRTTPIHCISFITRDSEPLMRRIARQSGGTYTHVEGL
ncbi:MAG: VWA domain-containing protein [Phycisphaerales bacterium]|nr:VWA domain-containing protein [Phycisphaerales bacterium]